MSFTDLALRPELLEAVQLAGFTTLTPIQAAALPAMLDGADVLGQARTGSGKTAAFGLSLLQNIDTTALQPQALVLCPTRELSEQVADELRRLARRLPNTRMAVLCGGRPFRPQKQALERGAQVIVGTPGRVVDHLSRHTLVPTDLKVLVLDEADRLLDMGFRDEVRLVLDRVPAKSQRLLFSATFPDSVATLSAEAQRNPVLARVDRAVDTDVLREAVVRCLPSERHAVVARLLSHHQPESALVFCETRNDCDGLADSLRSRGCAVLSMHGAMEQRDRDDTWLQLANRSVQVVVATNVAARGLDLDALPLVINAELSPDPTSHVHRIGRTARAGKGGLAVSVVAGTREEHRLTQIEDHRGGRIETHPPMTGRIAFEPPQFRTLLVLAGRSQKIRKGDLLGALVKDGGIPPTAIGTITLRQTTCGVAIDRAHAQAALQYLRRGRVKRSRVRAVLL